MIVAYALNNIISQHVLKPAENVHGLYLTCKICENLVRQPVQSICGCRFCNECILKYLDHEDPRKCPNNFEDCDQISKDSNQFRFKPDPGAAKELRNIKVHCPYTDCKSVITVRVLEKHLSDECEFHFSACDICKENVCSKKLEKHKREDCEFRQIECAHCGGSFRFGDYTREHINLRSSECCRYFQSPCPYCKTGNFNVNTITLHSQECTHWEKECSYLFAGCKELGNKDKLIQHNKTHIHEHLEFLGKYIQKQQESLNGLTNKHASLEETVVKLTRSITHVTDLVKGAQIVSCELDPNPTATSPSEATAAEAPNPPKNVNGKLVWKIAEYRSKKQGPSIISPHFYSNEFGYKMCLRAYLNGDGSGAHSHISVFLVIMKGEYDELLPWPFKQKVTLAILDQDGGNQHLSDTFRPDPTSACYQQPQSEMNVAAGCPRLASHSVIEGSGSHTKYLKYDNIYIRAIVDLNNLSHP